MSSRFSEIRQYFEAKQTKFLVFEEAVCWTLKRLLEGDSYPTGIVASLEKQYPHTKVSETVIQKAIAFLDDEDIINSYRQQTGGRGRPRRMLALRDEYRQEAQELVNTSGL